MSPEKTFYCELHHAAEPHLKQLYLNASWQSQSKCDQITLSLPKLHILNPFQFLVPLCHSLSQLSTVLLNISQTHLFFPIPSTSVFGQITHILNLLNPMFIINASKIFSACVQLVSNGTQCITVTQVPRLTGSILTCACITAGTSKGEHSKLHTDFECSCLRLTQEIAIPIPLARSHPRSILNSTGEVYNHPKAG